VSLPDADVPWIKAKLDTGARTSALHAFDVVELERDANAFVRFSVHPWQRSGEDARTVELPLLDRRLVRSSSGHEEERLAVAMRVVLARREITAEVTLTDRDEMGFRMLVGREALAQGFLVDSSISYAGGRPRRVVRRKNWGR
jgi:hypothetical protein